MAPLPVIPTVVQTVLHWTGASGATAENVMHFELGSSSIDSFYSALDGNVTASMWNPVATAFSVSSVSMTKLDGVSATITKNTSSPAKWSGAAAGDWIPQAAALVSLRTSRRGRSYRGRIYLPFVAESDQSNGTISGSALSGMQSAWDAFRAAMSSAGFDLGVLSVKTVTFLAATTSNCEPQLATQRRRMGRLR